LRVQKFLAEKTGIGRRKIEAFVLEGRVFVNGHCVSLGAQVHHGDTVRFLDMHYEVAAYHPANALPLLLLYHKPVGQLSARFDASNRPCVFDFLPACGNGRWVNVGRLDIDTSGLLLFTNDGNLAHKLMHPSFQAKRVYHVRVFPRVSHEHIKQLQQGVVLEDGACRFDRVQCLQRRAPVSAQNVWYHVEVRSGRYRMVRRMWESLGYRVSALKRVAYAEVALPKILPESNYRYADQNIIQTLMDSLRK
jgi:23S rRNA pseudouridine2605 synthase